MIGNHNPVHLTIEKARSQAFDLKGRFGAGQRLFLARSSPRLPVARERGGRWLKRKAGAFLRLVTL